MSLPINVRPWVACLVLPALGLAVFLAAERVRAVLRRRARRLHYLRAAYDAAGEIYLPGTTGSVMPPDRVDSISTDARWAAWRVSRQLEAQPANPHPARTREFVLWEATFHSALSDFAELQELRTLTAPAPDPGTAEEAGR